MAKHTKTVYSEDNTVINTKEISKITDVKKLKTKLELLEYKHLRAASFPLQAQAAWTFSLLGISQRI